MDKKWSVYQKLTKPSAEKIKEYQTRFRPKCIKCKNVVNIEKGLQISDTEWMHKKCHEQQAEEIRKQKEIEARTIKCPLCKVPLIQDERFRTIWTHPKANCDIDSIVVNKREVQIING